MVKPPPVLQQKIPITAVVVTKNEEARLARCLASLKNFSEVIVVDSGSADRTAEIAYNYGAHVINFRWNGRYPKKRQWILDHVAMRHEWVFFIDADEVATLEFIEALLDLDYRAAGYFVRGRYIWGGVALRYGLQNNKLCLIDRRKIQFPVVDDLEAEGMGEIEGHYQPVLKAEYRRERLGKIMAPILHYAYEDTLRWGERHKRYAAWEAHIAVRKSWPREVSPSRAVVKSIFRRLPFRPLVAFLHCYVLKLGVLDGRAGFEFARSRYAYYKMIGTALRAGKF